MNLLNILLLNKLKHNGGSAPSGIINITTNGTHNVKDYAEANVNVASTNNAKLSGESILGIEATIKNIIVEVNSLTLSNSVTQVANLFNGCFNLTKAPTINTDNIISMNYMFYNCSSLQDVPAYNTSKVSAMLDMFYNCLQLTSASLSNILTMCTNSVVSGSSNKQLKKIGLSSEQATACTLLPEWTACESAGWTTGY